MRCETFDTDHLHLEHGGNKIILRCDSESVINEAYQLLTFISDALTCL